MAPTEQPYYFGTKRNPLEQDYYEVLAQPNVHIHDLSAIPLKSFHERGLVMADDSLKEFDVVVLATGFDSFSGSMTQMGLKNKDGVDLRELWEKNGVSMYLGLTMAGFPNMFSSYTPQAPTALSNGPTIIEAQVETIAAMIGKLESERVLVIEAQSGAEAEWKTQLNEMTKHTLFPFTDSWWWVDTLAMFETLANHSVLGMARTFRVRKRRTCRILLASTTMRSSAGRRWMAGRGLTS